MRILTALRSACLSLLVVAIRAQGWGQDPNQSNGQDSGDGSSHAQYTKLMALTRPSQVSSGEQGPIPTGGWMSPEYKWFYQYPLPIPPVKNKKLTWTSDTGAKIDYYEFELKSFTQQIYPDLPATGLVGYDGIAPGPTLMMQQGQEAVVRWIDHGPSNMTVHVHGQYNRAPFDGWAADDATPGQYKDDYYPNGQSARTLWYHDHLEFHTGENNFLGQQGFYIISDAEEQALDLPSGKYDVPLALTSKIYNSDGSLNYDTFHNTGLWGDVIEVNGQPWPYFSVEPTKYRLRLLNGAISRTFSISFREGDGDDGDILDFDVIASDGGLFEHPVHTSDITIATAERYEIIIDFSNHTNQNITMRNLHGIGDNIDYAATDQVMRFVVGSSSATASNSVPRNLRKDIPVAPSTSVTKDFEFARDPNGLWLINGVGFADVEHRILTRPENGEDEIWILRNGPGGGTHPVHIHLIDFKILSRKGGRGIVEPYESAGWKDVVWLAAGEEVQVVARYAPWPGVFMFHCHDMVHEDSDMLVAFNVTQLANWGYTNDTIFIDPTEPLFRPKSYDAAVSTDDAIRSKIGWLYSTDPYNHGNIAAVYAALDAAKTG